MQLKDTHQLLELSDFITVIRLSKDGSLLAAGDSAGKVSLFRTDSQLSPGVSFTSHYRSSDYVLGIEVESDIKQLEWVNSHSRRASLLSSNSKSIKLWTIYNPICDRLYVDQTSSSKKASLNSDNSPFFTKRTPKAICRSVYESDPNFSIHSVSLSPNCFQFLSSDEMRIALWDLEHNESACIVVDSKPHAYDSMSEVITCARFHPNQSSVFLWGTTKGFIKIGDFRTKMLWDEPALKFKYRYDQNVWSELVDAILSAQFSADQSYVIVRDLFTIKVWDLRNTKSPLNTHKLFDVHGDIEELIQSGQLADEFEVRVSPVSGKFCTGGPGQVFVYNTQGQLQSSFDGLGQCNVAHLDLNERNLIVATEHNLIDVEYNKEVM